MMARKTDDRIILEMLGQGKLQKEIAEHFNVSPAAICKRLKRLQPIQEPESFRNLSQKEKKFALEIASGQTQTNAAMASFDATSRDSAKAMGYQLMQKPDIQMAISQLMQEEGLSRRHRVQKLKIAIDHADPNVSLKGLDQSWKLEGLYTEQHIVHIVNYGDLLKSYAELVREKRTLMEKLGVTEEDVLNEEEEQLKQGLGVSSEDVINGEAEVVEQGDSKEEGKTEKRS